MATNKTNTTNNPFAFESNELNAATSRKLAYTSELQTIANSRAASLMTDGCNTDELRELAQKMLAGDPADLVELIHSVYDDETIKNDAGFLADADVDVLKRMLESRRSDRSTCKKKGISSSAVTCRAYISAMYAELMLREALDMPYTGATAANHEVDTEDLEAVSRKIKSLQSKTCRLRKLAAFDESAKAELEQTEAEIERLRGFRPTAVKTSKAIIKDLSIDGLRSALAAVDMESLSAEKRAQLEALMAKIG